MYFLDDHMKSITVIVPKTMMIDPIIILLVIFSNWGRKMYESKRTKKGDICQIGLTTTTLDIDSAEKLSKNATAQTIPIETYQ